MSNLANSWSSKSFNNYYQESRDKFSKLYKGEQYLIKKYIKSGHKILDIGCAHGGMYKILKDKFKNISYTGLDFNKNMISYAKKTYPDAKFVLNKNNIYKNIFKNETFDVIIIFGILHLNPNWKKIILNTVALKPKIILFDLRTANLKKNLKKKYFLDLNLNRDDKKEKIPYYLIRPRELIFFLNKCFKLFQIDDFSYSGYASKFSNINFKINFRNIALIK